ncbi:MAG: undecaprenyl/decaprenyl-phosphate alpha-N-acetylglucosaminyl 1-phosphate transferase [Candidatus Omnitrophica bacterium]|nr:undecaprenyl/decaprenyl-phosphate alpha-N-acetylglucosaminyl 1-phosphate transferase [Candidatus Omnitrophota bacterium]
MSLIIFVFIYIFLFAFGFSVLLMPLVLSWASRRGLVAHPKKERLHTTPIPLLGGVGIFAAFYLTIIIHLIVIKIGFPFVSSWIQELAPYIEGALKNLNKFLVIMFCGSMIFFMGLIDDLKVLGPKRKLFFETVMGIILFMNGIAITLFGAHFGLNMVVTVLWVIAITNAFNLLDNIDGLAAGVAFIAAFMLLLFCLRGGQILISMLLLIFMGSLLGFLKYNYPPARIFMGDCGSLFIGFMMSTLIIMCTFYYESQVSLVPLVAPLMILSVPIYDTVSVIIIRIKNKQSPFVGDKNHFSHRLLKVGMTHREAVSFICLVGLCTGMGALSLTSSDISSQIVLLVQTILLVMLLHILKMVKTNNNRPQ